MKILIPTPVPPNLGSMRINYVNLIAKELSQQTSLEICWFIYMPSKIEISNLKNTFFFDIHSFPNSLDLLKTVKPDLILVNESIEPIQYSLSIGANFLKIPIISFILNDFNESHSIQSSKNSLKSVIFHRLKQLILLSLQTSQVSDSNERFFSRLRFHFYKKKFLKRTINSVDKVTRNEIKISKKFHFNLLSDAYLLPNNSWINYLKKIGIAEKKILVTGNPLYDKFFKISEQNRKIRNNSKLSILIVTDPLYEHGLWSKKERDLFLRTLLNKLNLIPNVSIAIKIHPSSEDMFYYKSLISDLKLDVPIFQKEILFDLINDYDIIFTFGFSSSHTQIAITEKKILFFNLHLNLPKAALIDQGIKSGFIKEISSFNELSQNILEFHNSIININEEFHKEREKFLFKFDGDSSKRISNEIMRLFN